jgi:hypothetical protein
MSNSTTISRVNESTLKAGAKAIASLDYATRIEGDCIVDDNSLAVRNLLNGNYDSHVAWQSALRQAIDEDTSLPDSAPYKERRARNERIVNEMVSYYLKHPESRR